MKYFGIIDNNFAAIFQLQWKIENISDMFLQYSVLCGYEVNRYVIRYMLYEFASTSLATIIGPITNNKLRRTK